MDKKDRIKGALLGLAIGDALGTTGEFLNPGEFPEIKEIVGGGVFKLLPGMWSDDTSLALCLADSLIEMNGFDSIDQLEKYVKWLRYGYRSSTGSAFDVGSITRRALTEFLATNSPYPGLSDEYDAGNGSIMRLAPIPIFFANRNDYVSNNLEYAGLSSKTTHASPACIEACQFMSLWISEAIHGATKEHLISRINEYIKLIEKYNKKSLHTELLEVLKGRYCDTSLPIISSGYVVHTIEVALWALESTDSFRSGMLKVVNLGGDADTAGAVYGQLAGCIYGASSFPESWVNTVYLSKEIQDLALKLAKS